MKNKSIALIVTGIVALAIVTYLYSHNQKMTVKNQMSAQQVPITVKNQTSTQQVPVKVSNGTLDPLILQAIQNKRGVDIVPDCTKDADLCRIEITKDDASKKIA